MKDNKILFILFIISVWLAACKTEYPNDVPTWLKSRIKECKKDVRENRTNTWNVTTKNCDDEIIECIDVNYGTVYGLINDCQNIVPDTLYYDELGSFICQGGIGNCNYLNSCDSIFNPVYVKTIMNRHF